MMKNDCCPAQTVSVKFLGVELYGRGKWGIVAALAFGVLVTTWLALGVN